MRIMSIKRTLFYGNNNCYKHYSTLKLLKRRKIKRVLFLLFYKLKLGYLTCHVVETGQLPDETGIVLTGRAIFAVKYSYHAYLAV